MAGAVDDSCTRAHWDELALVLVDENYVDLLGRGYAVATTNGCQS